jgi:sugar transferase EpsL
MMSSPVVKRALDVALSISAIIVLSPVLMLVAIMVRAILGSPVLFRQTRPGLGGRPFVSLVGPRPLLMTYLPLYSAQQRRRHEVRPGITGWAQVHGRNDIPWERKFELDEWYVDHQSLCLDFRILWMTAIRVLHAEGISETGHVSTQPFTGDRH